MEPALKTFGEEDVRESAELEQELGELFERTLRLEVELEAIVSQKA